MLALLMHVKLSRHPLKDRHYLDPAGYPLMKLSVFLKYLAFARLHLFHTSVFMLDYLGE